MIEAMTLTGGEHHDVDNSVAAKSGKVMAAHTDDLSKLFMGIQPGSLEAKKLWAGIDADAHSEANVKAAKAMTGSEKAAGMFQGKPLIPGSLGDGAHPQGDYAFLKSKLMYDRGYDELTANRICSSIKAKLYGAH